MSPTNVQDRRIAQLIAVPQEQRSLAWLQQSLQMAAELELATIPVYLTGYWSIKDKRQDAAHQDAAQLIHSVFMEEMIHMGLACNMLTTIGGTPQLNTLVPTYPCPLPGGVRPQLTVSLGGLSLDRIEKIYMEIEHPENTSFALFRGQTFPTIGAFYDAILQAFRHLNPPFSGDNQNTTQHVFAIKSLEDAERAINLIKVQGEGTSQSPDSGDELAHYYKFAEIYHGRTLTKVNGSYQYAGDPIPFPDVYPMGTVPEGGWPNPSSQVQKLLRTFNATYKAILDKLQSAWTGGGSTALDASRDLMRNHLHDPAVQLMQIPLPDGSGQTYGPDFILL